MSFTTINFIIFMIIVFISYYSFPKKTQPYILLIASNVFYGFASMKGLLFLWAITVITYIGALYICRINNREIEYLKNNELEKNEKKAYKVIEQKHRRRTLVLIVVVLIGIIVAFKYLNFIFDNVEPLLKLININSVRPEFTIILPIGLSFYTFMSLGYFIDVYRGTIEAERNFFKYALYVSYFPQIMQGPISDYTKLTENLYAEHKFSRKNATFGLQRCLWGFFKKLIIANSLSYGVDTVFSNYEKYTGIIWLFILIMYAIQLYADFSGYMDIACGCSEMLGITLEENFNAPYFSKSVAEFWRRWHMSLGTWFKNYLFYPLLRSNWLNNMRKKYKKAGKNYLSNTIPNVIALFITWMATGVWHGASWNYICWGLYYGIFLIMFTILSPVYNKWKTKHQRLSDSKGFNFFRIVRTFTIVLFGYSIFRASTLSETFYICKNMFNGIQIHIITSFGYQYFYYLLAGGIGTIVLFGVDIFHLKNSETGSLRNEISMKSQWKRIVIYIMALMAVIFLGAYGDASLNQFAYFQF